MFRFAFNQHKTLDVITLFHRPSLPSSVRAATLLKQLSAQASETATEDQATGHGAQNKVQRSAFELDIREDKPTTDQVKTILEYLPDVKGSELVEGAKTKDDAIRLAGEDGGGKGFRMPVVRDKDSLGLSRPVALDFFWNVRLI
ncbi:uncharacterized protein KY384_006381 [Bacidia gigantensis]|uniref:uncharacterized protein n=1 Tax=Bacidia gigantensis TaxID=2732470 RepID=UPI001D04640E|nr:uncharacterized protein KY384_006381 [Bacidia gigantensis]KAG8528694.1 hypothetical protein KY384_006381 [Bacidia gigantensis]